MPFHRNILHRYTVHVWLTLALTLLLGCTFAIYVHSEKRIDRANEFREQSSMLTDQLRQSSDDLTRMARTYVVTGDVQYQRRFEEILAIRDGRKPRPVNDEEIYWDLVMPEDQRPTAQGRAEPLLALMQRSGFTAEEMGILEFAKTRSDALARVEESAMRNAATDPAKAISSLHDLAYHQAKAGVMLPLGQVTRMANARTLAAVHLAEQRAYWLRLCSLAMASLLLVVTWRMRFVMHAILGGTVHDLARSLDHLGRGDFSHAIQVPAGLEESVLGHIAVAQTQLARIDAERRQAEMSLAEHRDNLESLVHARTGELENALHQADAASRAKSAFLSNMSHELRTPLNAVIGFSHLMLKSTSLAPVERQNLETIGRSGQHLLRLINDVLEISKIEAGFVELQDDACDIKGIAREVVAMLQQRASDKGISLRLDAGPVPPALFTDSTKLRLVLINLVGNAVKFTEQGQVVLRLETIASGPDTINVHVAVSDTGRGIAAVDMERIFDPFFQRGNSATEGGTGLGLAISREYLRALGGELSVKSMLGMGSTFRFGLDLKLAKEGVCLSTPSPIVGLAAGARGKRILVVDDCVESRELLLQILSPLGFQINVAADGLAAVAQALALKPDLIIMDWQMPKLDGLEAIRRIRAQATSMPPIFVFSANAVEEQRQQALQLGVQGFLCKPLDEDELLSALEACLDCHFLRAPEPAAPQSIPSDTAVISGNFPQLADRLQQDLITAIRNLDSERIDSLLAHIQNAHPELADAIARKTGEFQHREVWESMCKAVA